MPKFNFASLEQKEVPKVSPPVHLQPPKPPTVIEEISEELIAGRLTFEEIANSSEFKRLVYLIQYGKVHRGTGVDLERKLIKRQNQIKAINEYERGTKRDFKAVVAELKIRLKEQKIKAEEQKHG